MLGHPAQVQASVRELRPVVGFQGPWGICSGFVQEDASTPLHFAAAGGEAPRAD